MSKAKAAGVLGALILCGLIFLSTLAIADGDNYFNTLQGAFLRGCAEQAAVRAPDDRAVKSFLEACRFVVRSLKGLTPFNITPEDVVDAAVDELLRRVPRDCDKCLEVIGDLESELATNNTATDIQDALVAGCERRFSDTAEADECREIVGIVSTPQIVDDLLVNFPPLTVCQAANSCPLE